MTPEKCKELRAILADKETAPRPWEVGWMVPKGSSTIVYDSEQNSVLKPARIDVGWENNVALAAYAVNALPWLLDMADRCQKMELVARQAILVGYSYRDDNRSEGWLTTELRRLQQWVDHLSCPESEGKDDVGC